MKAIVVKKDYGLENLAIETLEQPQIRENEVLIKISAVSLNQLDLMIAKGAFGTSLPHIPGSDAVGTVDKIGAKVQQWKVGDYVSTHFIQAWQSGTLNPSHLQSRLGTDVQGVFSEYVVLDENSLIGVPRHLSPEEAAALPIAGLTAWEALVNAGNLKAGQTVLLQGTGGVSVFALQFAKMLGARVIITSGSEEKLAKARTLGADETLNYKTEPNWAAKVLELTGGAGVDLALEISWADIDKTIQAMKLNGTIVVVGLLGGATANLSVFGIMQKSLSIKGIQVGSRDSFREMNLAIAENELKPVVDKVFPLEQFKEAFHYFEEARHFGKVVIEF